MARKSAGKAEWYVAISEMSGTFAGNPPCFEASEIYGPYTAKEATEAELLGAGFPHESYSVTTFRSVAKPSIRALLKTIQGMVLEAVADQRRSAAEQREIQADPLRVRGETPVD